MVGRSVLVLRCARPFEFLAESIFKNRKPAACHSEADAAARHEVYSFDTFFAGTADSHPTRVRVCRHPGISIFWAQFPQCPRLGERDHVRDPIAWSDIALRTGRQSLVGACHSGCYRCVVLSVAFTSRFEGRTAFRQSLDPTCIGDNVSPSRECSWCRSGIPLFPVRPAPVLVP